MRLTELEPRWLHPTLFVFRCPHCRNTWLSCKSAPMYHRDQDDLFELHFGPDHFNWPVGSRPDFAWSISGDFTNLTVSPSIDASASRHWHGHIRDGVVV